MKSLLDLTTLLIFRRSSVCCERTTARRSAGTVQVIVSVGGEDDKVRSADSYQLHLSNIGFVNCFDLVKHNQEPKHDG